MEDRNRDYYEQLVESFRNQVADLEHEVAETVNEREHFKALAADRGEEVRGRGEDLRKYEAGLERVVRALFDVKKADDLWLEEDVDAIVGSVVLRITMLRILSSGATPIPIDALEAFLKRYETKACAEAEPVRGALLGVVQELAALMVRHCAPAGAGLLGGAALVEPAEGGEVVSAEHINGIVAECGAGRGGHSCTRPLGHGGQHECISGFAWGA